MSESDKCMEIIMSLIGATPTNIYAIESSFDENLAEQFDLRYCLCCYFQFMVEKKIIQIHSIESETGYTIYAQFIEEDEFNKAMSESVKQLNWRSIMSNNISEIVNTKAHLDGVDVSALSLYFSSKKQLHFVTGEVFFNEHGAIEVAPCDEMLLVFENFEDAEKLGLLRG